MRVVSYDLETQTFNKGNAFDSRNKLCLAGLFHAQDAFSIGEGKGEEYEIYDIECTDTPYREQLDTLRSSLLSSDVIVIANAKFELAWSRKYGIDLYDKRIWDVLLCHFILTNQSHPYPSLNDVAEYYGLGTKLDKIAEYWAKGYQTNEIPYDELEEYLKRDLELTLQIYYKQKEELDRRPHLKSLVNVSMMDTLVLADMEYNGLFYDFDLSQERAKGLQEKITSLDEKLVNIYDIAGINWNSNDHLSAILYGGILKIECRVPTERLLKDGTVKRGEKNGVKEVEMPRLVEPLKGSECAKEGYWKTAEDVLKSLKAKGKAKEIISLVLERSLLDKELNTYALGLPKLYAEKHWEGNMIHGNLNQVVARTGRLSSSQPNMQNMSEGAKRCIVSRFSKENHK
jgi:DNA polymerase I-like protein with 3'-5' exonuclease and polymerase domains